LVALKRCIFPESNKWLPCMKEDCMNSECVVRHFSSGMNFRNRKRRSPYCIITVESFCNQSAFS
jgi:hypothetical protein